MTDDKIPEPSYPIPTDHLIGRVVGDRFEVDSLLARGGMGKVYRAVQKPLGRMVALKVLDPSDSFVQNEEFRKRFFLEASVSARLSHPNTVRVFDYGFDPDGLTYIAMELIEGPTLRQIISAQAPLDPLRVLHVAHQICGSLEEAHALRIIHRDLKPSNIMMVQHGPELDFVKVVDFGLVKELANDTELTRSGSMVGSPLYMSPEQVESREMDGRSDIYSLGIMMYQMLIGKPPFEKANSMSLLLAHVQDAPPAFSEVAPELAIPEALEAIVQRMLAKAPQDRFEDVRTLDKELLKVARELDASFTLERPPFLERTDPRPTGPTEPAARRDTFGPDEPTDEASVERMVRVLSHRPKTFAMLAVALAALLAVGVSVLGAVLALRWVVEQGGSELTPVEVEPQEAPPSGQEENNSPKEQSSEAKRSPGSDQDAKQGKPSGPPNTAGEKKSSNTQGKQVEKKEQTEQEKGQPGEGDKWGRSNDLRDPWQE